MLVVNLQLYADRLNPAVARRRLDALNEQLSRLPGVDSVTECVTPPLGQPYAMEALPGGGLPPVLDDPVAKSFVYFDA